MHAFMRVGYGPRLRNITAVLTHIALTLLQRGGSKWHTTVLCPFPFSSGTDSSHTDLLHSSVRSLGSGQPL